MQLLFDAKGYRKALFDIEEQFYYAWRKEQLSQTRFIDWKSVRNRRNLLFNGVMERNRAAVRPTTGKPFFPRTGWRGKSPMLQDIGEIIFPRIPV
ncbi:hypothetical protein NIB75_12375 [Bacteroides uniformis]|nr:hypothetical protein [Bacteroides uniformis]